MNSACHGPCLFYTKNTINDKASTNFQNSIICVQADVTLNTGKKTFIDNEHRLSNKFECRKTKFFLASSHLKFNGANIIFDEAVTKI